MEYLTVVLLIGLATYRGTKLVIDDRITQAPRDLIQKWAENRWIRKQPKEKRNSYYMSSSWHSMIAYFLSCPWCTSVWVGGLVTLATACFVSLPLPALVWGASSAITGFLASHEGGE